MKIHHLLTVVLVIVLLVAYYVIGTDYYRKRQESNDLNSRVADITYLLEQTEAPSIDDIESQLAAATEDLNAAKVAFPRYANTTMIINEILKTAQEIGVKAMPMVTQDRTIETVNGFSYQVFRLHIDVSSDFAGLSTFQEQLENGDIAALVIENLSVERTSSTYSGSKEASGVSASMDIAVYSRPVE